jgi:hypothetical protein
MRKILLYSLLLFCASSYAQSPIARMVAGSQHTADALPVFTHDPADISAIHGLDRALTGGVVLDWESAAIEEVRARAGQAVSVEIPFENQTTFTLDLVPARSLSPDFEVRAASDGKAAQNVDYGTHFWGVVRGQSESLVSLSFFDHEVIGVITTREGRFSLGRLAGRTDRKHVLYRDAVLAAPQSFSCFTDDREHAVDVPGDEVADRVANPDNCVRMYVETDYTVYQNKGSVANVVSYMTAVFTQVSALYTNESVNLNLHTLVVWDVADPYNGPTASDYLNQFRTAKNGNYNGDLAHLVGIHGLGGVAYLDVLCNAVYGVGYSSIQATYSSVPTYSWTIEVLTHEIGHNLGSHHTHSCVWNGNNTAIDGCGPTAGYSDGCTAALPTNGGTIMSYCHLVSGVGINFNNGFGPQPGDRIRSEVYNASCLTTCGAPPPPPGECTTTTINTQNFEGGWGFWTDGGNDCARIGNATYANSPTYSIQLRDNTGNSVMTTSSQNWSAYQDLTVNFSYITVSYENGEDFWLQISTNGGTSYTTVGDFNAGAQFTNGVRGTGNVTIPGPFTANTRLRFRADASDDNDLVYIDDVVISGCQIPGLQGPSEDREELTGFSGDDRDVLKQVKAGPNPASDVYNVWLDAAVETDVEISIVDMMGRLMLRNVQHVAAGESRLAIALSELAARSYIVQIRAGGDVVTERLVIMR